MGIEIIRLGGELNEIEPKLQVGDLAQPIFQLHRVPQPAMSIWLMSVSSQKLAFPWWKYNSAIDEDLNALGKTWAIPNPQSLFDCLFLSHFTKFSGSNLFTIFPGCIKTEGWGQLRSIDRDTFSRGQGCIYHLNGSYRSRLSVNWVPFWEPQSMVRNPNFGSLWHLFSANPGDDTTRCLTFFGLSNPKLLPEVVNLFIAKDDQRSEKLAALVDWFGMYSSPLVSDTGTSAVVYTQKQDVIDRLKQLETQLITNLNQAQSELIAETLPRTAIRIMSRQIAL